MKVTKLKNGLTIIIQKKQTKSVAIEVVVKTGSNNEPKSLAGISHFIEHMLFEGTKKRTSRNLVNEIEKRGGEFNAYTANERTAFYITILKRHFDIAMDILYDIIKNPLFEEKAIKKEKKIILDEIKLVNDQPRFYQWVLFSETLFKKSPAKNPIYGFKETVEGITKKDLLDYYNAYYVPKNIIISIVGNISNIFPKIKETFSNLNEKQVPKEKKIKEPKNRFIKKIIKRQTLQSYVLLGYKTPERTSKDSYVLDVIRAILGRGQSGTLFEEIRQKHALAYEVGVNHESNTDYGFFAVYLGTHKKNIKKCISLILKEFKKLQKVNNKELKEAKDFLEGDFHLKNEENIKMADSLAFFEMAGSATLSSDYIKNIKNVTKEDVKKVSKKYLNKDYALAVIEQT